MKPKFQNCERFIKADIVGSNIARRERERESLIGTYNILSVIDRVGKGGMYTMNTH